MDFYSQRQGHDLQENKLATICFQVQDQHLVNRLMDSNWDIKLMGQRIINFNGKNWMNSKLSSDSKIRKTETEKLYKRTIAPLQN